MGNEWWELDDWYGGAKALNAELKCQTWTCHMTWWVHQTILTNNGLSKYIYFILIWAVRDYMQEIY